MKFTDILTVTDTNPLFYKFVPMFLVGWKKLFPEVKIHIVLISDIIIPELIPFSEYIILFSPIKNVQNSFIAQNIGLLYPCLLQSHGGVLVSEVDTIPMNRNYFVESIKNIDDDKFVCYRQLQSSADGVTIFSYNIALPATWRGVFSIKTENDIVFTIKEILNNNSRYAGHIKNNTQWVTDQMYLYDCVQRWNNNCKNGGLVILNDKDTNYERLDKGGFHCFETLKNNLLSGHYSDFRMYNPCDEYENMNEQLIKLLPLARE
tara:strand:- start:2646 stop:3431 length:786 start_codon:yes stop_codon:yes gene_type:complete